MGSAKNERSILLCGMMGSGKTTVGRALAASLGWRFLDTDALVEESAGLSIAEIFARGGERCFRKAEADVVSELPSEKAVIALGGGTVLDPASRAQLRETGTVVWLDAKPASVLERVGEADDRPLLAGLSHAQRLKKLSSLLDERRQTYADAADLRLETDGLNAEEVCEQLRAELAEEPPK